MFLVAIPAVYRSVARWLEGYLGFLTAVCASCFVHLSWTARSKTASSTAEAAAASSFVAHIFISLVLALFSSFQQGLQSQIFA